MLLALSWGWWRNNCRCPLLAPLGLPTHQVVLILPLTQQGKAFLCHFSLSTPPLLLFKKSRRGGGRWKEKPPMVACNFTPTCPSLLLLHFKNRATGEAQGSSDHDCSYGLRFLPPPTSKRVDSQSASLWTSIPFQSGRNCFGVACCQ